MKFKNLTYAPETVFSFKVIVTLTFDLVTPISRGLLPYMDNHPMKFDYCGPNGTEVMLRKPNCQRTDRQTDGWTPEGIT
jgi:hypothetical protein